MPNHNYRESSSEMAIIVIIAKPKVIQISDIARQIRVHQAQICLRAMRYGIIQRVGINITSLFSLVKIVFFFFVKNWAR